MKIKVIVNNVVLETPPTEYFVDVNDSMTIQELLISVGNEFADLSEYYPLSGVFTWNCACLPYLFINGKASYDVAFEAARVKDFLYTHNIDDNTIRFTAGYPWAGGPGTLAPEQIWEIINSVLQGIAALTDITGFSLRDLFQYLRTHFLKRKQPPQPCFDIVLSRKRWNSSELAEILELEPEKAKELLRLLDYQYDRKQMQYIQGEHTNEIKEKLMSVDVRDI